jgi:hypothetical protein
LVDRISQTNNMGRLLVISYATATATAGIGNTRNWAIHSFIHLHSSICQWYKPTRHRICQTETYYMPHKQQSVTYIYNISTIYN